MVNKAIEFLNGKDTKIKESLIKKMNLASKKQNYEQAAKIRDRIKALTKISYEKYSDLNNNENFGIIYCKKVSNKFVIQVFFFRVGKNLGNKDFIFTESIIDDQRVFLGQFLIYFYSFSHLERGMLALLLKNIFDIPF